MDEKPSDIHKLLSELMGARGQRDAVLTEELRDVKVRVQQLELDKARREGMERWSTDTRDDIEKLRTDVKSIQDWRTLLTGQTGAFGSVGGWFVGILTSVLTTGVIALASYALSGGFEK